MGCRISGQDADVQADTLPSNPHEIGHWSPFIMAAAWGSIDPGTDAGANHPALRVDEIPIDSRAMVFVLLDDREIPGRRHPCSFAG